MSTPTTVTEPVEGSSPPREGRTRLRAGWRPVAAKELADHVLSVRFAILLIVTALAGLAAVDSAASEIRDAADASAGTPSIFLLLFTVSADRIPSFLELIGFLGPLLGIGFGFDAINSERSDQTLPRLVAAPIHRDDVVTGKFAAGLGLIAVVVSCLTALVAGYGIVRLGITPDLDDTARIVTFVVVAIVYIAVWLSFAVLVSVLARRSSTGVLACLGVWLVLTLFAGLITGAIADAVSPTGDEPTVQDIIDNARAEEMVGRVSPEQLYEQTTTVLLNPQVRSVGIVNPERLDQAVPAPLPFDESVLIVWPQITALVAITVLLFIVGFLMFMRQEVRA